MRTTISTIWITPATMVRMPMVIIRPMPIGPTVADKPSSAVIVSPKPLPPPFADAAAASPRRESLSAVVTMQSENLSPNSISAWATPTASAEATASVSSDRRMSRVVTAVGPGHLHRADQQADHGDEDGDVLRVLPDPADRVVGRRPVAAADRRASDVDPEGADGAHHQRDGLGEGVENRLEDQLDHVLNRGRQNLGMRSSSDRRHHASGIMSGRPR